MRLALTVELFDDPDEVMDGVGKDVKIRPRRVVAGDSLDMGVDVGQGAGNVWGDTPGATWGCHGADRTTPYTGAFLGPPGSQSPLRVLDAEPAS